MIGIGPPRRKTQPSKTKWPRCIIRLFGTSSKVLTLDPQDNEENDSSDDDDIGLSFEDNDDFEDDADDSENGEEEEDREENRSFQSSPNHSESFLLKPGKNS